MSTIRLRDPGLQQLVEHMLKDGGKLASTDINKLVDAAYGDDKLSSAERSSLRTLLVEHSDKIESPEARQKLEAFTQMSNSTIRDAAHRFAEGGFSHSEARDLETLAMKDGRISKREKVTLKALMGFYSPEMEPGAKELVAQMAGLTLPADPTGPSVPTGPTNPTNPTGPTTPAGQVHNLGAPAGTQNPVLLGADGSFTLENPTNPGGRFTKPKAEAIYAAGELIAAQAQGTNLFDGVPKDQKTNALTQLNAAVAEGLQDADPSNTADMRMRAGAAATMMELALSAKSPEERELRSQTIDHMLDHLSQEPVRGLKRTMLNNLEHFKQVCSPEQLSRIEQLHGQIIPQKPPYEAWFKDGNDTVQVKQYLHSEFYDETIREYTKQGFALEPGTTATWAKTYEDPTGANPPTTIRIEVERKDAPLFTEMDDDDKHIIFYSGHSNLGGHTKNALAWSKDTQSTGDKLIVMSLCRGNQVAAAVSNRFPNDHQITTNDSVTSTDEFKTVFPMYEIMAKRGNYEEMHDAAKYRSWRDPERAGYIFPHDTSQYSRVTDTDKDGVVDSWSSGVDRLFNVGLESPSGGLQDLKARTNDTPPSRLDGQKLHSGIEFANTILHYHMENHEPDSPFRSSDDNRLIPGGWFEGDANTPIRITEEKDGNSTNYRVQVNTQFADQSEEALGALVGYEIANHLDQKYSGDITRKDMMRNFYLSNEYLYFMGGNSYASNAISKNLAEKYEFPEGLDFYDHQSAHRSASNHDIADNERIGALMKPFQSWIDGQ